MVILAMLRHVWLSRCKVVLQEMGKRKLSMSLVSCFCRRLELQSQLKSILPWLYSTTMLPDLGDVQTQGGAAGDE